jgi:O-antigen ligase
MDRLRGQWLWMRPLWWMGVLLLAPLLVVPETRDWHGLRSLLMQAIAAALLFSLLAPADWSWAAARRALRTGPNLAVLLLLGWAGLSFALTAPALGRDRGTALAELLRLGCGVVVYFAALSRCRIDDRLQRASALLPAACILAALAGLGSFFGSGSHRATAAYGNSQLLAAFLAPLLPMVLALAHGAATRGGQRMAAIAAAMVAVTLVLTYNRSAWLGSAVGVMVVAAWIVRITPQGQRVKQTRGWILPAMATLAALGLCLAIFGGGRETGARVIAKARTLAAVSQIGVFQWRLEMWRGCAEMIRARPAMGWGIGSFPAHAGAYSAVAPSAAQVADRGVTLSSLAHNEYLQLGAELGLIGLALYLAVLGGFFTRAAGRLRQTTSEPRKWLLVGALGAVAAYCVSALGNPGGHFGDVSPVLWLMLGLGMAAAEPKPAGAEDHAPRRSPATRTRGATLGRRGWQGSCAIVSVMVALLSLVVTGHGQTPQAVYVTPTTSAIPSTPPNANGTFTDQAVIVLSGRDSSGACTVQKISYRLSGAQNRQATILGCEATVEINTPGTTTITWWAVDNNGNPESLQSFPVTVVRGLTVSTIRLDFGQQPVGIASAAQSFTVTNTSEDSVVFTVDLSDSAGDFAVLPSSCSGQLAPGQSCAIGVVFNPTREGIRSTNLVVTDSAGGSHTVSLVGMGSDPIVISPLQLDLGRQAVGTSSEFETVTITNRDPIVTINLGGLTGATLGGAHPGDFELLSNGCDRGQLFPGATCSIGVRFSPTDRGTRSATLLIDTGFPNGVKTVPLTGFGTASGIRVTPSGYDFGRLGVGSTNSTIITVENTGDAPLDISSIDIPDAIADDFRITFESCLFSPIPPGPGVGNSCSIHVSFTPRAPTARTARLEIRSNAAGSPVTIVPLSGTGFRLVSPQELTQDLIRIVNGLVGAGTLSAGNGNALTAKLEAAIKQMDKGNATAAIGQLGAFINQVEAFDLESKLPAGVGGLLTSQARTIIALIGD